jgi:DNA-binding response OmpR family regulator
MRRVLIVEDDLMIAHNDRAVLRQLWIYRLWCRRDSFGCDHARTAHRPGLAVIDMELADGGLGTDVAATWSHFADRGPVSTADRAKVITKATHGHGCLAKPYSSDDLLRCFGNR